MLEELQGVYRVIGLLLYGSGLRLLESLRLRVKDVDFGRGELIIREAKGDKDRRTMYSANVEEALRTRIEISRCYHEEDLAAGWLGHRLMI